MRVLVTGASGFLGSHVAAGLIAAGHVVRVLARSPVRLEKAMGALGSPVGDIVLGDVTEPESARRAVSGCDAVVHSANVYSYDPRRAEEMERVNVTGTENVIGAAVEAGCAPVVHVSTAQVLWPLTASGSKDLEVAPLQGMPYSDSKKKAEQVVRRWQESGAPVVITYPGGILGADDPGPGEQIPLLRSVLVPTAPFRIRGGFPLCDVDWLTRLHVRLVEGATTERLITCSGTYLRWDEFFDVARRVTGRRLPSPLPAPPWLANAMGTGMDLLQRVIRGRLPFGREGSWVLHSSFGTPDVAASRIAGRPPPIDESFAKAVRWAVKAGHLTHRQAGKVLL